MVGLPLFNKFSEYPPFHLVNHLGRKPTVRDIHHTFCQSTCGMIEITFHVDLLLMMLHVMEKMMKRRVNMTKTRDIGRVKNMEREPSEIRREVLKDFSIIGPTT